MTSGTSHLGHKPRIIGILEFGHAHAHSNDGFIHSERRTTYRTAIRILEGRWTKGFIEVFSSTTVVDHMLSWFHTPCGGWNHGVTTGAVHGASRPGAGDGACMAHLADRGGTTAHALLSPP